MGLVVFPQDSGQGPFPRVRSRVPSLARLLAPCADAA